MCGGFYSVSEYSLGPPYGASSLHIRHMPFEQWIIPAYVPGVCGIDFVTSSFYTIAWIELYYWECAKYK